jgi:hypothetical protein
MVDVRLGDSELIDEGVGANLRRHAPDDRAQQGEADRGQDEGAQDRLRGKQAAIVRRQITREPNTTVVCLRHQTSAAMLPAMRHPSATSR